MSRDVRDLLQAAAGAVVIIGVVLGAAIFFAAVGDLIH